ncbi:MAG: Rod shape-determining protein MreC [Candidatus Nomurabacteria bacterium]|nr:Rod shape-determining protein MreC [Candidatus Nomurabacteria bacterium]
MRRYKSQKLKKKRPLNTWHPLLRIGVVVGTILFIVLATLLAKKMIVHAPFIYGSTVQNELLSKRALISKVNGLQNTINSYDAQLSTLSQLQNENDTLKAELGRTPAPTGILADVITLPNRSFYDTMMIDAGSADGIRTNMIVYAFGSVALGNISAVDTHTATVSLYSAPSRQTSGTATGSNVAVTLIGRGGGEYEVQLPRDVPIDVGVTISSQSITPATLATIEKIVTDPRDPFQRLLAKAPVNLQALKWVIVR